jgi:predicted AAA+ superfamily ATPase
MHPLTTEELSATAATADWQLLEVLNRGLVPSHYLSPSPKRSLRAYATDYLKEEIFDEGLTRNIPAFSRFFEAMSYSHGEQTNYANIARDAGVDGKTVKEYYQILVDTLLAERVDPFKRRQSRRVITKTPRYYLFDVGVAGALTGRWLRAEKGEAFGRALEHFVLMELLAFRSYEEADFVVNYWRTRTGLERDWRWTSSSQEVTSPSRSRGPAGSMVASCVRWRPFTPSSRPAGPSWSATSPYRDAWAPSSCCPFACFYVSCGMAPLSER